MESNAKLITTDFILIETASSLSRPPLRKLAVELIDFIRESDEVVLERANQHIVDSAWDLFKTRTDKEWSLTDCASFVVMKAGGIKDAFTSDHHFEQAGFNVLIKHR